ncbi:MAG: GNAT family N-acetyltransferase [Chloroflexi bacterium]|nr:GNAT family N-acetyltransferase [Chloroflexota bacterium]
MAQHALHEGQPKPDTTYLGVTVEGAVIGHIAIRRQRLEVPPSALTGGAPLVLHDGVGRPLDEMFVQTFAVEDGHRRQVHGRRLQQAAIQQTRQQGCYQLRSWSSADAVANYALKLSLGFAVHPALYPMPGGAPLSGVYFVMVVHS